jgi:hypothetical protein
MKNVSATSSTASAGSIPSSPSDSVEYEPFSAIPEPTTGPVNPDLMEAISLLITINDEDDPLSMQKDQHQYPQKELSDMPEFDDLFSNQHDSSSLPLEDHNIMSFDISKLLQHY